MFGIGDFARLGRVSVRMLRHYDAIGLLRPAHVDESTGYRRYHAAQLAVLNRIIALKDLGFTLQQVGAILDENVEVAEFHGMLRLRRAELAAGLAADLARLARVEARLSLIEKEGLMSIDEVVVKRVPAVRVAELTAVAASYQSQDITPVAQPLFAELYRRFTAEGLTPTGPGIAYYEPTEGGVLMHAGCPVAAELRPGSEDALAIVDLPAIEAATVLHRGSMDQSDDAVQKIARWIESEGRTSAGYSREVYLEAMGDQVDWVTEFQEPLA
ncbi:MerR family transcriptional regulator [Actinoalloteichus hymeniacidonis]|uniref:Transcriptional regulator n=1 Tax=Actinoalloteichus hymeniacidonis TaxID=340345 RepID=A0AAC9N038_9PSEU|nr:MerR family transcriptional regulator [Actinoalloteichus hymeniacidonis]AOS64682.1 putative transcriptional regulator [Actinoalloteichus hymeniacidonis]MBB5907243.1 DNA-binding transcriptional MerR regulator [Actinoalloteichus hymeniacidonis]